jgi:hypothetical protein
LEESGGADGEEGEVNEWQLSEIHSGQSDNVPWSRIVHFYGRATQIPKTIHDLASDHHAAALEKLVGDLEHQDSVIQATPFAAYFLVRMLKDGSVRDPEGVRKLLQRIATAAREQRRGHKSEAILDWDALLSEERLWPEFTTEDDDEVYWEEWQPSRQESRSWAGLTLRIIAEGI